MDIAEVARRSGVPASALRFYEEKGLISAVGRSGLRRVFEADVLERLALIALGRSAGFTLEEIGRMFAAGRRPRIDRDMLAAKAEELDATIRRLRAMRNGGVPGAQPPGVPDLSPPVEAGERQGGGGAAGEGQEALIRGSCNSRTML